MILPDNAHSTHFSKSYYEPSAFKTIKENYVNTATKVIATFAKAQVLIWFKCIMIKKYQVMWFQGLRIDEAKLKENIRGLIEFEQMIVLYYRWNIENLLKTILFHFLVN